MLSGAAKLRKPIPHQDHGSLRRAAAPGLRGPSHRAGKRSPWWPAHRDLPRRTGDPGPDRGPSGPLEDRGDPLPAADTHGDQCVASRRYGCSSYSALTARMAPVAPIGWPSPIATAVRIGPLRGRSKFPHDGQRLRGERLVHLDHIQIIHAHARAVQHRAHRRHRAHAHDRGARRRQRHRRRGAQRAMPVAARRTRRSASTTAAAASLIPAALPAVTVPPSAKTGLQLCQRLRRRRPGRMCSSVSKTVTPPFRLGTSHGDNLLVK